MIVKFKYDKDWVSFSIEDNGKLIETDKWTELSNEKFFNGISTLIGKISESDNEKDGLINESEILVSHRIVSELNDKDANNLSLPPKVPYILDLKHKGTLSSPSFSMTADWLDLNGQYIVGSEQVGCILEHGSKIYRTFDPFYSIISKINLISEITEKKELYEVWSDIQNYLPKEFQESIRTTDTIKRTRIAFATSFSLNVKSNEEGFDYDPVLFGKKQIELSKENNEELSENQNLLHPTIHDKFVENFNTLNNIQSRIPLKDGWYVYLDPKIKESLKVAKSIKSEGKEARKRFIRNPTSVIKEKLQDSFDEIEINEFENVFIETTQYSERVLDVGVFEKKVLPWIKRKGEEWFPDTFGLQIGESFIQVKKDNVTELKDKISDAVKNNKEKINWDGTDIPANQESLDAVNLLVGLEKPENLEKVKKQSKEKKSNIVLLIEENFENIGYKKEIEKRNNTISRDYSFLKSTTKLKKHQEEGFEWLCSSWERGLPGVLLADDMGLGKTLQALSFLMSVIELMKKNLLPKKPILIVAPTALLENWIQEMKIHIDEVSFANLHIEKAYGNNLDKYKKERTNEISTGKPNLDINEFKLSDIILTTYETLRDYQHSLCSIPYQLLIFDEMQKIKTPGTIITQASKSVKAEFILGLTGTPIENRLSDLWCIFDTLFPQILGTLKNFSKQYEKDDADPQDNEDLKNFLSTKQDDKPPLLFRRMKEDVLDSLPKKTINLVPMEMPSVQEQAYSDAITKAFGGTGKSRFEALSNIRSISLHPLHPSTYEGETYIDQSARLKKTFEILDEIKLRNEKALIFLESREMQPLLAMLIKKKYKLDKLPLLINGAVSGKERQNRVNEFQQLEDGFNVMILSPKAGGVGLTLTAANNVIHLQRWWNPAVEDQCTDRVFRIGQTKDVNVYIPQSLYRANPDSSFDVKIDSLLESKRLLSRNMLVAPVDFEKDRDNLFEETIKTARGSGDEEDLYQINIEEIDGMEPIQFEEWVISFLSGKKYEVNRTPKSHDGGADIIAKKNGIDYIIQCKHTGNRRSICDNEATQDLIRAKKNYKMESAGLISVTNANGYSEEAKADSKDHAITLIDRNNLVTWIPN